MVWDRNVCNSIMTGGGGFSLGVTLLRYTGAKRRKAATRPTFFLISPRFHCKCFQTLFLDILTFAMLNVPFYALFTNIILYQSNNYS